MKAITQYAADDGTVFDSQAACKAHDALINKLACIFRALPPKPRDTDLTFANGTGYIQHDAKVFNSVVKRIEALAHKHHPSLKGQTSMGYVFWRTLDDNDSPIYHPYGQRILNTNRKSYREYGQMYYAEHENEVSGGQLNV